MFAPVYNIHCLETILTSLFANILLTFEYDYHNNCMQNACFDFLALYGEPSFNIAKFLEKKENITNHSTITVLNIC